MTRQKHIIALLSLMTCAVGVMAQDLTPVYKDVDCGEMLFKKPSTFIVELKNTSTDPVEIKSVDTGCGCTTADYTKGKIQPGAQARLSLTFDGKQLGHFSRVVRVYTSEEKGNTPAEILVQGVVVTKIENYSGEYPYRKGALLVDKDNLEFDDVNKGQKLTQEIHIMNISSQNASPVMLRLPPYLKADMHPAVLGPKQKGIMRITLNSAALYDYGLNQTTVYLGKNTSDKVTQEKQVTISAVLLPPAVSKDNVNRPYAGRLKMSRDYIDMTPLRKKSKYKDEIILTNTGRKPLEIQKLQLFTTGVQVSLDKQKIEPGGTARLTVTCKAKDLKKLRVRPRLLMITDDPSRQKVVVDIKR